MFKSGELQSDTAMCADYSASEFLELFSEVFCFLTLNSLAFEWYTITDCKAGTSIVRNGVVPEHEDGLSNKASSFQASFTVVFQPGSLPHK